MFYYSLKQLYQFAEWDEQFFHSTNWTSIEEKFLPRGKKKQPQQPTLERKNMVCFLHYYSNHSILTTICFSNYYFKMSTSSNRNHSILKTASPGKPTVPFGRQPSPGQKINDPSSSYPKEEHYPIPSFLKYTMKASELELRS